MHPEYFRVRFKIENAVSEWPENFAIITAFATTGETWGELQNAEADRELTDVLRKCGGWFHRITGYSPDTGHAEPGWAVSLDFESACEIGLKFKQDAIYYVRNDCLFVTFCDDRREPVPVGLFTERLDPSDL